MTRSAWVLLAAAVTAVTACTPAPSTDTVTVTDVIDGDTVELDTGDRVRLIGIDTPERGDCGYVETTEHLSGLVDDQSVTLTAGADDDTDRYGRLLRYIDVDGTDAGLAQIEAGLARARYDSTDGYGAHPREDLYHRTEEATGLPVCVPGIPTSTQPGVVSGGYPFCEAAQANGDAPLHEGDDGWNPDLDGDGDGVACE